MTLTIGDAADFVTLTRPSTATYFDASGILRTAAANVLRLDYDPVTHAARGALIKGAATNYCEFTEDFGAWSATPGLAITSGASLAPNGNMASDLLIETATSGLHGAITSVPTLLKGDTVVLDCFVKPAGRDRVNVQHNAFSSNNFSATYDLNAGIVVSHSGAGFLNADIIPLLDGWYYIWVSGVAKAGDATTGVQSSLSLINVSGTYTGDGVSGVYAWGFNIKKGASPSSYIKSTGAVATCAADVVSIPTSAFPWSSGNGVLTLNGMVVEPILADEALDVSAILATAGVSHLETLKWVPA